MKRSDSWLPLVPAVVLIATLEGLCRTGWIPAYLAPAPSEVLQTFFTEFESLRTAALETLAASLTGFVLAAILGILIGVFLSSARWIQAAFFPYAIFFQTVPIIAIAPLLVIWFGFGMPTVITSALIVCIFPVIAATLAGIQSTEKALMELFSLYRATAFQTMVSLKLPFALPQIFTGLRISAGLAVIGAIVGEFIAGGGLGGLIDVSRTRQRVDIVFAAILLASAIGLLLVGLIRLLRKISLRSW